MFNFAKLKKSLSAGVAAVSTTDYTGNTDFLEAVCAVAARVAYADGNCSPQERQKTIDLVTGHAKLGGAFTRPQIEQCLDKMMRLAADNYGRQQLAREMDDVHGKPNGAIMAEDAYLIGVDVAAADGNTSPEETEVLEKIAKRLGVDLTKFDV